MVSSRRLICRLTSILWHMPLYSVSVQTSRTHSTHTRTHTHTHNTHTHAHTHTHTHTTHTHTQHTHTHTQHTHTHTTHTHTHNTHTHTTHNQFILAYLTATILHKKGRPAVTYTKIKEALHKEFQVCQQMVSNVSYIRRANGQSRGSCTAALLPWKKCLLSLALIVRGLPACNLHTAAPNAPNADPSRSETTPHGSHL